MKKSNIFLFTWENTIFLKKDLDKWVSRFSEKYSEFNISRINKDALEKINIEQELTSPPFFSEHRLIILDNIPSPTAKRDTEDGESAKNSPDDAIEKILDNIPDANFVLFVSPVPDVRKSLFKKISLIANVKDFPNLSERAIRDYVRTELLWIDNDAISRLIEYKGTDLEKIEKEIDKLSLFRVHDRITVSDIEKYVTPDIEVSVFQFIDRIYELNFSKASSNLSSLLENEKIEPTFAAIMTTIRKYLFVLYLKKNNVSDKEIIESLKVAPFVFQKIMNHSKNENTIRKFYEKMCEIDLKSKTGELMLDNEDGLIMAIEKVIFDLKNMKNTIQ
ncbi:MAG: DNA polymerase III, delta subunit [uncultured bacterium (gcode 4)]|uniref:DNA polymerase III, delta subunit n=1 Tax=uncultured bacterium (gcode 4) TaxID=1234023 RepID=K2GWH4_9BACT|nr:MAG: DNA polymerase III, delta subunit [uncultured bacterium (gcode 4)]